MSRLRILWPWAKRRNRKRKQMTKSKLPSDAQALLYLMDGIRLEELQKENELMSALTYDSYQTFFHGVRPTMCRQAFDRTRGLQDKRKIIEERRQILDDCLSWNICPRCGSDLKFKKSGKPFGVVCAGTMQNYVAKCCKKTYTRTRRVE